MPTTPPTAAPAVVHRRLETTYTALYDITDTAVCGAQGKRVTTTTAPVEVTCEHCLKISREHGYTPTTTPQEAP